MMNIAIMGQKLARSSLLLILGAALASCNAPAEAPAAQPPLAGAKIGGPFVLTDQDGKTVRDTDFAGKYRLVYFGYSFCPDICPVDVQKLMRGLSQFEKADAARGAKIVPMFITVDPERDSPEVMKAYVGNFGARLVGLTGSAAEIAAVAKAYRVYYAKTGDVDSADYLVDHTSIIYLMAPDGSFRTHFTYTTDAEKLADGIVAALDRSP